MYVPLTESIEILLDNISTTADTIFHNYNRKQFKRILELSLSDSYFQFNNKFYKQFDGLGMG
jgi:hypothetical protein